MTGSRRDDDVDSAAARPRGDAMGNVPAGERSDPRDDHLPAEGASPLGVLYLPRESARDRAVPSALDAGHGMNVHVVDTRPAVAEALTGGRIDCVVAEGTRPAAARRELVERVHDRRPDLPLIAYAATDGDPQAWFRAGADDYLSRDADTDRRPLLAHRIQRCVAARRAKAASHRFGSAVESAGHPILIANPEGHIEYVNGAFETLLGDDRDSLVGRPLTRLRAPTHDADAYRDCWETVTDGDPWSGELPLGGTDGTLRIDLTATPVRDGDGGVERIVAVGAASDGQGRDDRELERAREKYRSLVDAAPDAVLVADVDTGEIVEANDAAAELLDRPRSGVVGLHQSELHPEGDRERYRRLFATHQRVDETIRSRFDDDPLYVETAAGDHVPVEISADVVELDDRTLLQGHFRDVSGRRDREQKLRSVLDAMSDIAIVYSESGTYEEVLSGREDKLVDSPDALRKSDIYDALPAEQAERIHGAIRQTLETGETRRLEYRLPLDGETRHFEARISPLRTGAYGDECVVFLARDITTRKHREQELRSFRQAVEHAGHVIMITETDGTIEYVNPEFESVTGYSSAEALGRDSSLLSSGEHDDDDCYRNLWETILDGDIWEGELVNERKNGDRYHVEQTIAPITDETGTIERFVAVNTDITDRKQYERQLERERDRLEEFARTVAHDLRNPLSIALGHVDLARQTADGDSALDVSLSALERMERMIEEILTLSKQGETVREPSSVRFEEVVETAWGHVGADVAAASLSMSHSCAKWTLTADESRLRQLLENLLRNAVRHAGPDVAIRVGCLSDRKGFFVADDGPGIEPSERNRIFESGYTSAADGTGFGLAIVRQIADAHGWDITVTDGEAGGGARFEITTTVAYRDRIDDGA